MEKIPKESLEQIMKEIEASTEKKALELMKGSDGTKIKNIIQNKTMESLGVIDESKDAAISPEFGQKLMEIMGEGDKEFQKKTGRRMTYSEMRQMYG
uniref:Uncharacterized protein n=1 Tax=viral metagenome TaxID=1070528 RepID=A0A6C0DVE2_9ZZZZ